MKQPTVRGAALVLGFLAFAPAPAAPLPFPRPGSDAALATAGLTPFTPETGNLSLAEFRAKLHPLKADLVITRVVLDPPRPKVGEAIGATVYYKNIGGKPATRFYLRALPGSLTAGGFGLGGDYARLAPGQEKPYSWGAITAATAGAHSLTFTIDPEGSVEESNVKNNQHVVRVVVN